MKTISGKPISTKPISLSKAAKILSKFVSAENGASQVISAYLHRASSSFNELNQLHKELKSPHSDRKHKRNISKSYDDGEKIEENFIQSVEINQELNLGAAHSMNQLRKHQIGSENTGEDEEKASQTIVKFSQELNEATEYHAGNEGGSERHKKKKKKHGIEIGEREGEHKPLIEAVNENEEKPTHSVVDFSQEPIERGKHKKKKKREDESKMHVADGVEFEGGSNEGKATKAQESLTPSVESRRELGYAGDDNKEIEEGKKHKREKKKKKDKDGMNNFSRNKGEVIKPEDESAMRTEDQKEILSNGLEGKYEGLVDHQELQSKSKKRYKAGSGDKINTDEVKRVQKKRKNEDVEGRVEDRSGESTKKIKRKHGGDD